MQGSGDAADSGADPRAGRTPPAGRARWRPTVARLGARINVLPYLPKWVILATVIGLVAGVGAVVFYEVLTLATHFFLGFLAGYQVPTPAGEGNAAGSAHYARPWAIPLVVGLGALLSGVLVFSLAPEAEGHGTDAAIDAVHHNPRGIRLRAVVVKIIASALTIGSGGSGGREGPTAQISAGFGSLLARLADLSPEDGRIAVSVGIGSGIGAIFSAPLGGAVLAADIVYRDDFEYEALLPGTLASIIAYGVFGAVYGYRSLFAIPSYHFHQPVQLVWFALIGLLAGGIGLLYSTSFYGVVDLSSRLPFTKKLRPAVGGVLVGLIALGLPEVLGTGYGWVQKGLGNELVHTPLLIIVALPFARIVATSLSIGTGGSGGVFGPGMVIGAFTGLAVWRVLEPFAPGVGHDPAPFVVVGMMAVFGSISRAPIAVMLMVAEMTGSISIVAPAMVAVAIAWFVVERADDSIYRSQLRTRADSAAARMQFGLPTLGTVSVGSVADEPTVVLGDRDRVADALRSLRQAGVPGAPVVDPTGTYVGTADLAELTVAAAQRPEAAVATMLDATTPTVAAASSLDVGLEALLQAGGRWVTVTGVDRHVAGILSAGGVVRGSRDALAANVGRIADVTAHVVALEERVGSGSPVVAEPVRAVGFPPGTVIVTVQRGDELLFATGDTTFAEGDVVSALTGAQHEDAFRRLLRGTAETGPHGPAPGPPLV